MPSNSITTTTWPSTPTIFPSSSTQPPSEAPLPTAKDDLKFLIIPLIVIVVIMVLSALVYLMARRRHNRELLRETILSMYDFEEETNDEWDPINSYDHDSYDATKSFYWTSTV